MNSEEVDDWIRRLPGYQEREEEAMGVLKGGPGSGHHGHRGRPGKRGGSLPSGSGGGGGGDFNAPTKRTGAVTGTAMAYEDHLAIAEKILAGLTPEQRAHIEETERKIKEGTPTHMLHRNPDGSMKEERLQMHEDIINEILGGASPVDGQPEVVITGGLPGAGKSTVLKQRGSEFNNHVHIDSDQIKAKLPEYEGWNAALVHEEASMIVEKLITRSVQGNYNVIYDATLKTSSSSQRIVNTFETVGYSSKVIFTDVPMQSAMERAVSRFFGKSQRYVPLSYLATHDTKNIATFNSLKGVVDSWEHWDNSQPYGEPPTLVSSGSKVQKEFRGVVVKQRRKIVEVEFIDDGDDMTNDAVLRGLAAVKKSKKVRVTVRNDKSKDND